MSAIRTSCNPLMLTWAREEVGYSIEQAAKAIGISPDALVAAEAKEHFLTLNQLRRMAEKYDIPFGYFYLSEPPYKKSYSPVPDFRIEPGLVGAEHYRLNLEIKKCRDRRDIYFDLVQKLDEPIEPFQVIQRFDTASIGSQLREKLGVSSSEISCLKFDQVYSYWKEKIENDGVLVYESQYIPDESGVIGAAIFYEVFPIILIKRGEKNNDRKLFTLLHEYAHLLKGISAINDASSQIVNAGDYLEARLESECNRIAAETLVPSEEVNPGEYVGMELEEKMEALASSFKVTFSTAAVCLKRMNIIDQSELSRLLEIRLEANKKKRGKADEIRIPRENIMRLDMGRPMFATVLEAYSSGVLDVFDASSILNLRVKKIDVLLSGMR